MTKESKTDHKRWRDEFELTGENPIAWQLQARSHLAAANVLLERVRTLGTRGKGAPSAEHEPPHLRMMPVYLLFGFALENLVKGLLVARGETATWSGSFEDDRSASLDKGLKHHCLTDLFRVASVKTNADEKRLLESAEGREKSTENAANRLDEVITDHMPLKCGASLRPFVPAIF